MPGVAGVNTVPRAPRSTMPTCSHEEGKGNKWHIFNGLELNYSQADMAEYRMKLGMDILRGSIHYLLQPRLLPINRAVSLSDGTFLMAKKKSVKVGMTSESPLVRPVQSRVGSSGPMRHIPVPSPWSSFGRLWPDPGLQNFAPQDFSGRPVTALGHSTVSSLYTGLLSKAEYSWERG